MTVGFLSDALIGQIRKVLGKPLLCLLLLACPEFGVITEQSCIFYILLLSLNEEGGGGRVGFHPVGNEKKSLKNSNRTMRSYIVGDEQSQARLAMIEVLPLRSGRNP
jgi:hypothetical protein